MHALAAYKTAAERIADDVLGTSADILEQRDREGRKKAAGADGEVGMRDVLKSLSRVIDR